MNDLIQTAADDAEAVKGDALAEVAKLRAEMTAELAKVQAAVTSPHGAMIFGIAVFVAGFALGHFV